uniref:Uncharacterized protein n=1 Tax=Anguilla anguilla TaxID=7936 RepID=A0A0E9R884_ANGAN
MKVSLGNDVGVSTHLQASKTGNTRFFTSNTQCSVVLQVSPGGNWTGWLNRFRVMTSGICQLY